MKSGSWLAVMLLVGCSAGCSVKKYAIHQMGEALAGSGGTFASDDDPELIRQAVPFSLKLIETLIAQDPRDQNLLLAAARGFAEYSYAFVQEDADEMQDHDPKGAAALRTRAANLYLRARDYGLRGLIVKHPNFLSDLKENPLAASQQLKKSEVPLIYWTAVPWAAALSASKDIFMLPEIPRFEALLNRALEMDESYDYGAIHGFMITYEMARLKTSGDRAALAKEQFDRAMALSGGHKASPLVSYAEAVMVPAKNQTEFDSLLRQALRIDVNKFPEDRQLNMLAKRRARWLLSRQDKLFPASGTQPPVPPKN